MIVFVMSRDVGRRTAVAAAVAHKMGWNVVHVADDFVTEDDALQRLRTRVAATISAGRPAVFSSPLLSVGDCRALRAGLPLEIVRLSAPGDAASPYASGLALDGTMDPGSLAATIRAILRLGEPRQNT